MLTRSCTNPPPANGGKNCDELGPANMTDSCNEQECPPPCIAGLDIGIVLDKSRSINKENLERVIEFLADLVRKFNPAPDGDHFGLITFDKFTRLVFNFSDSEYYNLDSLEKKIESEPTEKAKGYGTRTDLALIMARDELFTQAGGDRQNSPNVMLLLTDGKPSGLPENRNFAVFSKNIVKDFKKKEVHIVAVGIGHGINTNTLKLIAGKNGAVFNVASFQKLQEEIDKIKSSVCSEDVSIVVVGILGKRWENKEYRNKMKEMAGKKGQVLRYPNFDILAKRFNEVLDALSPVNGGYTNWTISECTPPCIAGLDIGIVLDKSQSIDKKNLERVIEFLADLVRKFNPAPDEDHFGLITFDKFARLVFNFSDSEYYNLDSLERKIESEPTEKAEYVGTRTDRALIMARDQLFTEAGGDRQNSPNVMLVLTDGKPYGLPENRNFAVFSKNIVKDFKEKEVHIVAVGIGHGINTNTLKLIAGKNGAVFNVASFQKLQEEIDRIKSSVCSGMLVLEATTIRLCDMNCYPIPPMGTSLVKTQQVVQPVPSSMYL
ncbi:unnamed protein product [Porites lobata]|uniref:VWFA domain-containing protein n=1 Tax=Porites lobata TaxID=104759 RepID=A0ABN8NCS8_9CNID|nr:unnamed protein product [Porites lobata]